MQAPSLGSSVLGPLTLTSFLLTLRPGGNTALSLSALDPSPVFESRGAQLPLNSTSRISSKRPPASSEHLFTPDNTNQASSKRQAPRKWGEGPNFQLAVLLPAQPGPEAEGAEGLGMLRRGPELSSLYPTFLPRMWGAGEGAPRVSPTPRYSLGVESQPFRGGRASRAFGLRETCQPASSSLNPILRKPSLSCLLLSSRW